MDKILNSIPLKFYKITSIGCILIGFLSWIPNLCGIAVESWPIPIILSPIGFIMALMILTKKKYKLGIYLAILNIIIFFSPYVLMYLCYILNYY